MMRTLNFALILVTGMVCIATYRIAEDARVASATLVKTERQIAREQQALVVLGAEWARVTRPQRIQALAERHLTLSDAPVIELASFELLPHRGAQQQLPGGPLQDINVIVPDVAPMPEPEPDPTPFAEVRRISHRSGA